MELKKKRLSPLFSEIFLESGRNIPLFLQLSSKIKELIVKEYLVAGDRLPSIRSFGATLQISPDTVKNAYTQLMSEGLIVSKQRSGFVVEEKIELKRTAREGSEFSKVPPRLLTAKMKRAALALEKYMGPKRKQPFACFVSSSETRFDKNWSAVAARIVKGNWSGKSYGDPFGYLPLRKIICERLRQYRGILCDPDQIVITTGTTQSLSICSHLLFQPGDSIVVEDPSLPLFKEIFAFAGLNPLKARVDCEGMVAEEALADNPCASGVFVSPPCQYPMSVSLSRSRREGLVAWANKTGGWIIEDDIDNLLSFSPKPLLPIRSLPEAQECTIYLDSFSLLIYPGIRLGYMLVPKNLATAVAGTKLLSDRQCPESMQGALTQFLSSDSFETRLRRLVKQCQENKEWMANVLTDEFSEIGEVWDSNYGSHLAFLIDSGIDDKLLSQKLLEAGVMVNPLSKFCSEHGQNGLVMGFCGFTEEQILSSMEKFKATLRDFLCQKAH